METKAAIYSNLKRTLVFKRLENVNLAVEYKKVKNIWEAGCREDTDYRI
jgi:hypothetical protein